MGSPLYRALACGLVVCAFWGGDSRATAKKGEIHDPRHRLSVIAAPGTTPASLATALPEEMTVLASHPPVFLLFSRTPVTDALVKALRALPQVAAAHRDAEVGRPRDASHAEGTSTRTASGRPKEEEKCVLTERCANGKPKYWAQSAMAADLMHLKMNSMGVTPDTKAKVAVVDSGFDKTQDAEFETVGEVIADRGAKVGDPHPVRGQSWALKNYASKVEEVVGDPAKDENGHGTMVSSVIAGKGPLGVARATSLAVYRVTKPGNGGSASISILHMALWKACQENKDPDGLTVINMSWGGRLDETGLDRDEEDEFTQKLLDMLTAEGCLVVKSAGNSNFRKDREYNPDDAYLRVAAVDPTLGIASFSTTGEIQAPGEDIYVIDSTQAKHDSRKDKICEGEPERRFVNGTSFAAPFTAGLASQVVRVLKHFGALAALNGADRIRLVNRILRASASMGTVNGLRAVTIAQRYANLPPGEKNQALAPEGERFLASLLDRKPPEKVCEKEAPACEKIRDCGSLKNCVNLARAQLSLCEPDVNQALDLARTAFHNDSFETGFHYGRMVESLSSDPKLIQKARRDAVHHYLTKRGYYTPQPPKSPYSYTYREDPREKALKDMNVNFIRLAVAPYLEEYTKSGNRSNASDFMERLGRAVLKSSEIKSSLEMGFDPTTGEDRGSNSVLDAVHSILKSTRASVGDLKFKKIIDDYISDHERYMEVVADFFTSTILPVEESTAPARVLDRLIRDEPADSRMRTHLVETEKKLLGIMRKFNQHYGKETQVFTPFFEVYPSRSTFNGMMERNFGDTLEALKKDELHSLAPVEAHYLMDKVESVPREIGTPAETILKVLRSMATDRGWGHRDDPELLEAALAKLVLLKPRLPAEEWEKVRAEFRQIVTDATNMEFLTQLVTGYWDDEVFGMEKIVVVLDIKSDEDLRKAGMTYRLHPLLDEQTVGLLSYKIGAALRDVPPEAIQEARVRFDLKKGIGSAWKGFGLLPRPPSDIREIAVPVLEKEPISRLSERHENAAPTKTVPLKEVTFDSYMQGLFRLARIPGAGSEASDIIDKGFQISFYDFDHKPEIKRLLEGIPSTGQWRNLAQSFASGAKEYQGYLGRYAMKSFLERLDKAHQERDIRYARQWNQFKWELQGWMELLRDLTKNPPKGAKPPPGRPPSPRVPGTAPLR